MIENHIPDEIQRHEVAEAYVRGRLGEAQRAAFEDHCYACGECFEEVQTLQKFIGGVRDAAEKGLLPEARDESPVWWLRPAFLAACAACLVLAPLAGWSVLVERPRLQALAARERADAASVQQRIAVLGKELAEAQLALARPAATDPNLPLVMLDASRAGDATAVALPFGASQLALWIEPPPTAAETRYRLEISPAQGPPVAAIDGLVRNAYGALAATVPAARLAPGSYRARLFAVRAGERNLAGEYRFEVRR